MLRFGTPPRRVADRAIRGGRAEILVGWDAHVTAAVERHAPGSVHAALGAAYRRFVAHR
ncbi:MAG: hypothetical protein KF729_31675 [Sandaracinaceae bacterium]|nr:hypothetical protein [Sandaracinaceae bacterium]